jgi:hypothetical protein
VWLLETKVVLCVIKRVRRKGLWMWCDGDGGNKVCFREIITGVGCRDNDVWRGSEIIAATKGRGKIKIALSAVCTGWI